MSAQGRTALVLGASGLLGRYLLQRYRAAGFDVTGTFTSHPMPGLVHLDVRDQQCVMSILERLKPSMVVIAAAATAVDFCEQNPETTAQVNVLGIQNVAQACARIAARTVFVSTDYVFNGRSGPYSETDPTDPINVYGQQKQAGELAVQTSLPGLYVIARTTWVFGAESPARNFVARLIERTRKGEMVRVPRDQVANPSYAGDVADMLIALATSEAVGLYNVCGSTRLDRYSFALLAARLFDLPVHLIQPASTEELGLPARRPLAAGMTVSKITAIAGRPPLSAEQGLLEMRQDMAGRRMG